MMLWTKKTAVACTVLTLGAALSASLHAQEIKREEMVTYYLQTQMLDANKDGMVSKKEFMDAMSKTWDMHMDEPRKSDPKMPKDKMTLQQYLEFSKMLGLNIGS